MTKGLYNIKAETKIYAFNHSAVDTKENKVQFEKLIIQIQAL